MDSAALTPAVGGSPEGLLALGDARTARAAAPR